MSSSEDEFVADIYNELKNERHTFIRLASEEVPACAENPDLPEEISKRASSREIYLQEGGENEVTEEASAILSICNAEEESSNDPILLLGTITEADVSFGEGITIQDFVNSIAVNTTSSDNSILESNLTSPIKNQSLSNDQDYVPDLSGIESDSDSSNGPENNQNIHNIDETLRQDDDTGTNNADPNPTIIDESQQLSEIIPKRRKRAEPDAWEKNMTKRMRMTGKKYIGYKRNTTEDGKVVVSRSSERSERKLRPRCDSVVCKNSKKRHCPEFDEKDRQTIFDEFWALTWKEKEVYVKSHVSITRPKTRKGKEPTSRRSGTFFYHLRQQGISRPVCKKFFLSTLDIKEWMAHNMLGLKKNRQKVYNTLENDNVSSMSNDEDDVEEAAGDTSSVSSYNYSEKNKTSGKKNYIIEWLDKLPKLPAHYCRKDSTKLYLESVWDSKVSLYKQYKKDCINEKQPLGCKTMFFQLFETKNLAIYLPRKDQCDVCCGFKAGNVCVEDWNLHRNQKDRAREEKDQDKALAKEGKIYCLTADVEAVKVTPFTLASAMYYKTKLCNHNYTIYNLSSHQCTCYWYSEVECDLSASAFASCLVDYLQEKCTNPPLPIVIYTDGCTNQNRNQYLANALLHFARQHDVKVTQKFLVKGHTQMEGDSVHAMIERKLKNKEVYVPYELVKYTKEAREKPSPYEAKYLYHDFFKDYSKVTYYDSIRPGKRTGDPVVTDIHVLHYSPVGKIQYQLNFDDEPKDLPRRAQNFDKMFKPPNLFKGRIPIPEKKYKHLQELKSVIPREYHGFYDELPYK